MENIKCLSWLFSEKGHNLFPVSLQTIIWAEGMCQALIVLTLYYLLQRSEFESCLFYKF